MKMYTTLSVSLIFLMFSLPGMGSKKFEGKYFEQENGLKVFLLKRDNIPLLHVVMGVNIGSKDETDETDGLVHILEHYILFRGAGSQYDGAVLANIRKHGAHFNAHTGRDVATFEISVPAEHSDFALSNQKDILFNLRFDQETLEKEKQVILEEITKIQDDPIRFGRSLVLQNLFRNHAYERPVYGVKEIVAAANIAQLEEFHQRFFTPQNCSLAIVGKFDVVSMEEKVRKTYGTLKKRSFTPAPFRSVEALRKDAKVTKKMDINRAYLFIGFNAPDFNSPDSYSMDLFNLIMGRGVNPMLGYALRSRSRKRLIQSLYSTYISFKYGGAFVIRLTLDAKNIRTVKNLTLKFLRKSGGERYSKSDFLEKDRAYVLDYLENARNQTQIRVQRFWEQGLGMAISMARYLLLSPGEKQISYLENISKVTSSDLRRAASKYLGRSKTVIVTLMPKTKEK